MFPGVCARNKTWQCGCSLLLEMLPVRTAESHRAVLNSLTGHGLSRRDSQTGLCFRIVIMSRNALLVWKVGIKPSPTWLKVASEAYSLDGWVAWAVIWSRLCSCPVHASESCAAACRTVPLLGEALHNTIKTQKAVLVVLRTTFGLG